ncbi:MAG: YdeI/OmpD-associated family protein [Pseudomonadota bacterium]
MAHGKTVDDYLAGLTHWQAEVGELVKLCRATGMEESIKWGAPCYSRAGKNVVGVNAFKAYFGLWFYQGALLDDRDDVLLNAQAGKTKALRQWRMHAAEDIRKTVIKRYLKAAAELADSGQEIRSRNPAKLSMPAELEAALNEQTDCRTAFEQLRPGQQREYANYIAEAKRTDTKQRRIEKVLPMIRTGAGLNDRYR